MYNRYICEQCGAHLDPNEHCDCEIEKKRNKKVINRYCKNLFEYMNLLEEDSQDERITI